MAKTRRTKEQVAKAVAEIDALRAGGMMYDEACDKVGLARSVYGKAKRNEGKPAGQTRPVRVSGKVRVDSLPPRPKKGGKRPPKPVDMTDIASVATRIAKLDRKLHSIDEMVKERIDLVGVLVKLLKAK